uniref:Uncharacterized protein n=1 Tax=Oryza sativa subsp. japonica TaxID=39947 RepID=Q69U83_ORYSJ|nr:hypothetical protein [Oryza sativa Japonica Group]
MQSLTPRRPGRADAGTQRRLCRSARRSGGWCGGAAARPGGGARWRARSSTGSGTRHHAPLHAQLLAPPLPGTGTINEIREGVGKHYSVNVPLDTGRWAAKASSSRAPCAGMLPCVIAVGGEPR